MNETNFFCPITQEMMVDPVTAADGHTYERSAIEHWFSMRNRTSPVTNLPLPNTNLVPNHALKSVIEVFKQTGGVVAAVNQQPAPPPVILPDRNVVKGVVAGNIMTVTVENPSPLPVSLILVVDRSGSMSNACQEGSEEAERFSRLDLVKHSIKTLVNVLRATDSICIIIYNDEAKTVVRKTRIGSEANKKDIMRLVDTFTSNGGTNLRTGLQMAYNAVTDPSDVIVVLTDGEFEDGDIRDCKNLIKDKPNEIHTMAYGYGQGLMSGFMAEMSRNTAGCYYYIPDGSMVGTTFVHLIANQITTCVRRASCNGIYVGSLHINQPKYVWVPTALANQDTPDLKAVRILKYNIVLNRIMSFVSYSNIEKAKEYIISLMPEYTILPEDTVLYQDLNYIDDSKGQILKAIASQDTFTKWGKHYIPSFVNAHARQEKTNFKDESMRLLYETPELKNVVDELERIFLTMPPPKPSRDQYVSAATRGTAPNMRGMMSVSTGCFTGDSIVGGVMIQDVMPGDIINGATVKYVVRYVVEGGATICRLGGFGLTPYHPVREGGFWKFPCDIAAPKLEPAVFMLYNLVLETNHTVSSHDKYYEACTLGHGFTGEVIAHSYFGTQKCVKDIEKQAVDGVATFTKYDWIRDASKRVIGMIVN